MPLVFAGVSSHGPGMTSRRDVADPEQVARMDAAFARQKAAIEASEPDVLLIVAAEHFANFFMNNMPSFAIGMADGYEGPIEDPDWLGIPHRIVPGRPDISEKLIAGISETVDISYCQEWKFDHGIMVPLSYLSPENTLPVIPFNINCQSPPMAPLNRVYELGRAIRRACDAIPERVALLGSGALSHWPCTPESGRINEAWDRKFLEHWTRNDRASLTAYSDEETYREGGQGAFEIRTYIAVAGAVEGQTGELWCYEPIPPFACGATVGVVPLG
jgi:hypothetical protein